MEPIAWLPNWESYAYIGNAFSRLHSCFTLLGHCLQPGVCVCFHHFYFRVISVLFSRNFSFFPFSSLLSFLVFVIILALRERGRLYARHLVWIVLCLHSLTLCAACATGNSETLLPVLHPCKHIHPRPFASLFRIYCGAISLAISESAISIPSCIIKRISRTRSRFCIGSS